MGRNHKMHSLLIAFLGTWLCAGALTGCGQTSVVGLRPEYPPVVRKGFSLFADFVEVDTLTPTFRWQPLSAALAEPSLPDASGRFEDVTYEIRIWRTVWSDPGKLVYARANLASPAHRLETPLAPATRYLWSVRAHLTIDGRRRTSEWSMAGDLLRDEAVPNDSCLRFETPE